MHKRCLFFAARLGLLAALLLPAAAPSSRGYDLPTVNLGFTSFLDGGPPAGPGLYFAQYFQFYTSDSFRDHRGDEMPLPDPRLNLLASLSQFIYQSDQKVLFGGKWGLNVMVPVVGFDLTGAGGMAEKPSGLGDIWIGPYLQWDPIMGEKGPIFMHRIEFTCVAPLGQYSSNYELNPGSGFFSFNPYWSGTWFIAPRWTTSVRAHYLWNDSNDEPNRGFIGAPFFATEMQAGQAIHLNFALDYELIPKRLRLGFNGYYLKQITDTEVNGKDFKDWTGTDRQEEVLGLGPGAVLHFNQNNHLFFNAYFETAVENRTQGQRFNLRFVHHF